MAEFDDKAQTPPQRPTGRRVYVPPSLRKFGSVGALTQSGSGMVAEMGYMQGGQTFCQTRTDRQLC